MIATYAAPAQHGTYVLSLKLDAAQQLTIGKLGRYQFEGGFYAYVGSAFGSGGLRARLGHHRKTAAKPHWHIDYLRQAARLEAVWLLASEQRREHDWATVLAALPDTCIAILRFGASDCKCPSHLVFCPQPPPFAQFTEQLQQRFPQDAPPQFVIVEAMT